MRGFDYYRQDGRHAGFSFLSASGDSRLESEPEFSQSSSRAVKKAVFTYCSHEELCNVVISV